MLALMYSPMDSPAPDPLPQCQSQAQQEEGRGEKRWGRESGREMEGKAGEGNEDGEAWGERGPWSAQPLRSCCWTRIGPLGLCSGMPDPRLLCARFACEAG